MQTLTWANMDGGEGVELGLNMKVNTFQIAWLSDFFLNATM